jgi:hypothetical protein
MGAVMVEFLAGAVVSLLLGLKLAGVLPPGGWDQ